MEVKWCCKFLFLFFGVASCYSRVEILQNAVLQFKAVADRVYFLEAFSLFLSSSFIVAPAKVRYSGKKKKKKLRSEYAINLFQELTSLI